MEFSKEMIEKAKKCGTAEELIALAGEYEIDLTAGDASAYLADMREGELADEEIDGIAGGSGCTQSANPYEVVQFNTAEQVRFIFEVGDLVEAFATGCDHHTATCKVTNRRTATYAYTGPIAGYVDEYYLEKQPGVNSSFIDRWCRRNEVEK